MFPASENSGAEYLPHSSNDGRCLGLSAIRSFANTLRDSSSLPNLSSRDRRTRPQAHRSALIGLCLFSTSGAVQPRVPHWSSTSSSSSSTRIAISKLMIFKLKLLSTTRLSGLIVPVSDKVLVKVRNTLDEAQDRLAKPCFQEWLGDQRDPRRWSFWVKWPTR
ncbi:hypothetical protein EV363DRAFT_746526 [Boletus edulis]|nr:hypothetical protein EV363DRAFT_746526 [Boletus edulis]